MYQPEGQPNQHRYSAQISNPALCHRIDILCLAILFVGLFSCLIRSDYNFTIVFFVYFVWQQRKDSLALKIILASVVVLIVFDIIFAFTQIRVWMSEDTNNQIWQTIRPMHNFGVFCFALIMLFKIGLLMFSIKGIMDLKKAVQVA